MRGKSAAKNSQGGKKDVNMNALNGFNILVECLDMQMTEHLTTSHEKGQSSQGGREDRPPNPNIIQ